MGGYISFGKYNANYKFILFYILSQLAGKYLFQKELLEKIGLDKSIISDHKLIQEMFNYLGILFFSIILLIYENFLKKERNNSDSDSLSNKAESNFYTKKLIYKDQLKGNISLIKIVLIIFLLFLERQSLVSFYKCGLKDLDFWMFEMFFIYIISSKIMGVPTYKHQIISVYFVIIFSCISKIISNILIYFNSKSKIYKTYEILIPLGVIIFLLITYTRAYVCCKIKWLIDLKYISSYKLLVIYGLIGIIICGVASIITTYEPCEDKIISFEEMIKICAYKRNIIDDENKRNNTFYYYENFIVYHDKIYKDGNLTAFGNVCLIIMKTVVSFFVNLFSVLIIKNLNPLFFICARFIYYFFVRLIDMVIYAIKKENIKVENYFDLLSEVFGLLGILVYTELVELNFCDLNHNLKKNIIKRSEEEVEDISDIDVDDNSKLNNDNDDLTINSNDITIG